MASFTMDHPVYDTVSQKRFILASTSPRRLAILNELGFNNIEILPSDFPEDLDKSAYTTAEYVLNTALGKGLAVWDKLENKSNVLILSADTVVECDGEIFEKPDSKEHQLQVLKKLRDSHSPQNVYSGVVLITSCATSDSGYVIESFVDKAIIHMDYENITDKFLEKYVDSGEGSGVAAGYRIQGIGAIMVDKMEGDYMTIVGLPFKATFRAIERILNIKY